MVLFQTIKLSDKIVCLALKKCWHGILLALILTMALISPALAENNAQVKSEKGDGYGRIIFTFDRLPKYQLEMLEGVLVIKFNEPVNVQVADLSDKLDEYIVVARTDPDKTAVRFALAKEVKINKIEAAEKLFIDLLPSDWKGLPPSLPEEVIAELASRAEEASLIAKEKILQAELRKKKNHLLVRYGELPTFTRLFFDWKIDVDTKMERNGDVVTLRFNHFAQPIIKNLKTTPPKFLKKIDYNVTRTELVVNLKLDKNTDVRGFKEGFGFVIDLSSGDGGTLDRLNQTISDSEIERMGGFERDDDKDEGIKTTDSESVDTGRIEFLSPSDLNDKAANVENIRKQMPDLKQPINQTTEQNKTDKTKAGEKSEAIEKVNDAAGGRHLDGVGSVKIALKNVVQDDEVAKQVNTDLPANLANISNSDEEKIKAKIAKDAEPSKVYKPVFVDAEKVKVEVIKTNRQYQVNFPFREDVPIAVFERDDLFWLIFEKNIDFDLKELREAAPELIKIHDVKQSDESTTLRLKVDKRLLSQITSNNSDWILSLGELVLMDTKVVKLARKYKQDGQAIVQVNLSKLGKVHWFDDDTMGDRIAVVTAMGPARGLLKTHNFVEFVALPSIHGLTFQAIADDLNVVANFDQVVISSRDGLSLTVGQEFNNQLISDGNGEINRPVTIEFRDLNKDSKNYIAQRRVFNQLIDNAEDEKTKSIYRLEMVEFLLSFQLPVEALGMLELNAFKSPIVATTARYKNLEGAALVMARKYKQAIKALSNVAIRNNRTATLFRAIALSKTGVHQEALKDFEISRDLLAQLPPALEADFLIPAIDSALQIPNLNIAQKHLIMMQNVMRTDKQKAAYWMMMGKFSAINEEYEEAILRFREALKYDIRPINAEVEGLLSLLEYQTGKIKIEQAIEQLNGNIVMWRGDDIGQLNQLNLGKLYLDNDNYRDGIAVLKNVASSPISGDMGIEASNKMSAVFEQLYLGGKADQMTPFRALGLFYDYKELIPIGRKGDEMTRKLVDRLIDIDLLDQAVELLDHQVNKRLKGFARADVAAKLAMVQMLNYQPEKAIQTIAKTRIGGLPSHIIRKRDLLEARALVEVGRIQSAITRLEGYSGDDISIIKSEAYWRGGFWQKAGEEFEKMVLNRWKGDRPLLDTERHIILRSAIAFKMAHDDLSIGRLRKQYMAKMENTAHAGSFNLVVDKGNTNAVEFRKLAREVAEIDMLKEFISDYRSNEAKDVRDRD